MYRYWIYLVAPFLISSIGLILLSKLSSINSPKLKKHLLIFSGKSSNSAQLLGGLPVALSILTTITISYFIKPWWSINANLLMGILLGGSIITLYGYLDDRYELRPIVKLFSQFLAVSIVSSVIAIDIGSIFSTILFIGVGFFGMGVLNGTNLLDGLDMMSVKISLVVYATYFWAGVFFESPATTNYAMICIASIIPFSMVNKYPSRMHLGEIGGTFIGFTYLLLFTSLYKDVMHTMSFVSSFCLSIFPMTISMCETGVSFMRRLMNDKSPFKGDKFHLHHILTNYYKLSVPSTTNILAIVYGAILFTSLGISAFFKINMTLNLIMTISATCLFQFYFGKDHWIKRGFNFDLKSFLKSLRKEELVIIDNSKVDSFEFRVLEIQRTGNDEKKAA